MAKFLNQYRKTIAGLVGVAVLVLQTENANPNWVTYLIAVATVFGVWVVPNKVAK